MVTLQCLLAASSRRDNQTRRRMQKCNQKLCPQVLPSTLWEAGVQRGNLCMSECRLLIPRCLWNAVCLSDFAKCLPIRWPCCVPDVVCVWASRPDECDDEVVETLCLRTSLEGSVRAGLKCCARVLCFVCGHRHVLCICRSLRADWRQKG